MDEMMDEKFILRIKPFLGKRKMEQVNLLTIALAHHSSDLNPARFPRRQRGREAAPA